MLTPTNQWRHRTFFSHISTFSVAVTGHNNESWRHLPHAQRSGIRLHVELLNSVREVTSLDQLQRMHQLRHVAAMAEKTPLQESVPGLLPYGPVAVHGCHVEYVQVVSSSVLVTRRDEWQLHVQVAPRLADTSRHKSTRSRQVVCNDKDITLDTGLMMGRIVNSFLIIIRRRG